MLPKKLVRSVLLAWVALSLPGLMFAQQNWNFPDFSATQVFASRKAEMAMKVFRSGSTVRVDRSSAMSTLYVPSRKTVYNLTTYPDNSHQCVSMKPEQARMLPSPLQLILGRIVNRKPGGTEVVEGHAAKIEDVEVEQLDGKTIHSRVWLADDLQGIPVQIESYVGKITLRALYRDVVVAAPDANLLRVPDRCTPFEKMGQVAESHVVK